ncbi:hypothetical protein ACFFWE_25895 [Sphaerisporangium melleum]|nr:hypothetical protein [Sphaerisporangium melleum]
MPKVSPEQARAMARAAQAAAKARRSSDVTPPSQETAPASGTAGAVPVGASDTVPVKVAPAPEKAPATADPAPTSSRAPENAARTSGEASEDVAPTSDDGSVDAAEDVETEAAEGRSASDTVEVRIRGRRPYAEVLGVGTGRAATGWDAVAGWDAIDSGGGVSQEVTAYVRRLPGPFPDESETASPAPPLPDPPARPANERSGPLGAVLRRVGDIPIRAVYGVGALIVTVVIVILIFTLFAEDRPAEPVRVDQAQGASGAPVRPVPSPIAVPKVPAAKPMTVFRGAGTTVAAYVVDRTAGISYAQYAAPWAKTARQPFSAAQKVGPAGRPQALIASGPVPVAVGKAPVTYGGYRTLAAKAVRWTLRYQPAGSKFAWTVSQRARYNLGWVLGYKVSYLQGGKRHTSQAYVMVIAAPSAKKPAMLFANVTDARPALYHDLNMLFWTARAL